MNMSKQETERHANFERWLTDMNNVLQSHKFTIETGKYVDKAGRNRVFTEIFGQCLNGYLMYPPAFPKGFTKYITENTKHKITEEGNSKYKINYGEIASVYTAYTESVKRISKINNLINNELSHN